MGSGKRKTIKQFIPNLITLGNLLCGCISISYSIRSHFILATLWMGLGLIFDFSDGLVARLLKVESEMGKQLDSLSDLISFGMAPSVFIFMTLNPIYEYKKGVLSLLPQLSWLIVLFSAFRLSMFNLGYFQSQRGFVGLPTPANAIWISSVFILQLSIPLVFHRFLLEPLILFLFIIISSVWLILPLPLVNLKFKGISWDLNWERFLLIILFGFFSIVLYFSIGIYWIIPSLILTYILYSIIILNLTKPR